MRRIVLSSQHRDLAASLEVRGRENDHPPTDPVRLIAPMRERFIATDLAFAKVSCSTLSQ
ncbi:DUF2274 domain-containing protein [Rhizobium sp. B230/85]|uniref:DUF2274 domain-containing protein n=1 Tax=unclassified Rhizobium TaxID=2613769 RepID=UPI001ADB1CF8|nr:MULTISPECIES: DUF2274 domain-containing protein [unclassified Rhizobium]MBO9135172.1 DUF2274 domain-containing protein [Rhizobium sp. B209b/85]QXZ99037.1 DUF2274 domain-containing protein [Rhizobium sp. B230/85]